MSESSAPKPAASGRWTWLLFVALAGLSWGTYVPVVFYGGKELTTDPTKVSGRLMSILCVGMAYFLLAVLVPSGLMSSGVFTWPQNITTSGLVFSGLAGVAGAVGAICVIFASKSAVDGITKALGCELGESGITVNALGPTVFRSPLTAWMYEDTERAQTVRKGFLARVPKGRLGEPEDLAGPLLFLASRASDFYTGHILYADGGYTAG